MTIIKFKDGTEVEALVVNASTQFVQGSSREVLEFVFTAEGNSIDALKDLFHDNPNTESITLINGEDEYLHLDYSVPTSNFISLTNDIITPETSETPAVYERRIKVELAQQTYLEKSINAQQAQLLATQEALDFLIIGGM